MKKIAEKKIKEFESLSAFESIENAVEKFSPNIALANSMGAEDMVIVDMLSKINPKVEIFTLDTGRLHQDTYNLIDKIKEKYGINIIVYFPENKDLQKIIKSYGPNLFYKSVEYRKLCCNVRKIEPLKRALKILDAWICGLRKEQSVTRTEIKKIEFDSSNNLYKVNPLADWSEKEVWDYIRKNEVPYNALHDKDFPSIGCLPCTRAIKPGEDTRAGRWWWEDPKNKECGLHSTKGSCKG